MHSPQVHGGGATLEVTASHAVQHGSFDIYDYSACSGAQTLGPARGSLEPPVELKQVVTERGSHQVSTRLLVDLARPPAVSATSNCNRGFAHVSGLSQPRRVPVGNR